MPTAYASRACCEFYYKKNLPTPVWLTYSDQICHGDVEQRRVSIQSDTPHPEAPTPAPSFLEPLTYAHESDKQRPNFARRSN